jgi:hypothetical protein
LLPAHCIQNKGEKQAKSSSDAEFTFVSAYENVDRDLRVKVSEFIVHPDWDPEDSHYGADIAIAVLKEPVKLAKTIGHVCLNTPSNPIQSFAMQRDVTEYGTVYGWDLTFAIWGLDGFGLEEVKVPLVRQAKCNSYDLQHLMSDTSFCAGAKDGKSGPIFGKNE